MIVAGIMSGTSADGIDVALVRITPAATEDSFPRIKLLAHESFPFSKPLRKAVLEAMNAQKTSTAQLARLNWRLGLAYAEALKETLKEHPVKLELVGCHGQTLYHQAARQLFYGERFACTWQAGEASVIAGEIGVPVVSNFRPADMVAGGQGAPLVPLFDLAFFSDRGRGRVLQNIGGIANMTVIKPSATDQQCVAFDCGPGNMVIDALMTELYRRPYDAGGAVARSGKIIEPVIRKSLSQRFFRLKPPKTAGREQFGREFTAEFLRDCRRHSHRSEDAVATATAFTAAAIVDAYIRFGAGELAGAAIDFIVSGGGTRNETLMRGIADRLKPLRVKVVTSDQFGLPAEAKEAAAFALLAWQTWHRRPGNLPSATGAKRPAILGQVTFV